MVLAGCRHGSNETPIRDYFGTRLSLSPCRHCSGAATLSQMYPDRLWLALGSGEAINKSITGAAWPDKQERNARLFECAQIIRALFAGETVTHRGRVAALVQSLEDDLGIVAIFKDDLDDLELLDDCLP